MNNWHDFYAKRVNSTYQIYFEQKYKPFLDKIVKLHPVIITEGGCGIASISKYFTRFGVTCQGFDNDPFMVKLSRDNCPQGNYWEQDLLNESLGNDNFLITHGVLEHFSTKEIESIIERYPNSFHYVPSHLYDTQSYGDEKLTSPKFWMRFAQNNDVMEFNDGYDLMFKGKNWNYDY